MLRYGIVIAIFIGAGSESVRYDPFTHASPYGGDRVRKAFGATGGELMRQVFFENFVLTLLAGVVGLALSYAATFLLNDFLQ